MSEDGEEQAGHFASSPARQQRDPLRLANTNVRWYEILHRLGDGGMGVVYKAYDTRLERYVALKFLPQTARDDDQARAKLLSEARAACGLDHENICTVYEIGETERRDIFLAMAFYEGDTLRTRIASGPLGFHEALDYSIQIARGLSRAHSAGVVHRDVKPDNLLVTADGTVKILDFGIARTAGAQATGGSSPVGTPGYTSPEQIDGQELDQRTDVWALGVVMYQMFTGEHPFPGKSRRAVLAAVRKEEPEPPTALNPAVSVELERIILKCLQKDKHHRYGNVDDVLSELESLLSRLGRGSTWRASGVRRSRIGGRTSETRRTWIAVVATLVLLLSLGALTPVARESVANWILRKPAGPRMHVAVLPFAVNDQNDPALQALAQGLVPTFTNMISRLQAEDDSLWVVPASEIVRARVSTSAEARRLMGVDVVLTGMLHKRDSAVEIQLELVDPAGVRQVASRRIAGPLDPEFEEAATEALRELLNLAPTGRTVAGREPLKPGARHLYIQGLGYLRRYDIPENLASAVTLFSAAIARDSLYAAAHAGLCEARWEQYRRTRMAHRAEQAFESCDRAASISGSEPTVLITLGRIFLERGDPRRAESSLRRASGLAPDNPDAWVWLGRVHEELGRLAEAEGAYRRAIRLKPSAWKYYWELGQYLAYFSRHAEALEQFESVRELAPDNPLAYLGIGYSQLRQDRVEDAEAMFQVAIERGASATAYHDLGLLYLRQNDFDAAIEALRTGLAQEERHLPIWRMLGHALYWTGQEEAAREAWSRMLDLAETNLQVNPRDAVSLMALAEGNVLMNRGDDGRRSLDRLLELEWQPPFHTYEIARLYEIMGQRRKALLHLEQALGNGFDQVAAERDPWLASLREDPGYGQLLQHIEQDAMETNEEDR